jgi:hypothetical protein
MNTLEVIYHGCGRVLCTKKGKCQQPKDNGHCKRPASNALEREDLNTTRIKCGAGPARIQTNFFHTITRAGCKSPATSFYWYTNVSSDCRSEGIALCSRHKTERLTFLNNMTQEISETDFAVRSVMLV